jgi:hypothetical protein
MSHKFDLKEPLFQIHHHKKGIMEKNTRLVMNNNYLCVVYSLQANSSIVIIHAILFHTLLEYRRFLTEIHQFKKFNVPKIISVIST